MKPLVSIIFVAFQLVILGCASTDLKSDSSVDPQTRRLATEIAELANRWCSTHSYDPANGQKLSGDQRAVSLPIVKKIELSPSGWYRAEVVINAVIDNVYHMPANNNFICGDISWRKSPQSEKSSFGALLVAVQEKNGGRLNSGSSVSKRPIAISWDGYAPLMAGTVQIEHNGNNGKISALMPNSDGACSGVFQMEGAKSGTWAISCSNGMSPAGRLAGFGSGKGSSGEGIDSMGRRVQFTVSGPDR